MFEQAQYTIYKSKKSPGSRMGDSMALTHNLSNGLMESDFHPGAARKVTGGILIKIQYRSRVFFCMTDKDHLS